MKKGSELRAFTESIKHKHLPSGSSFPFKTFNHDLQQYRDQETYRCANSCQHHRSDDVLGAEAWCNAKQGSSNRSGFCPCFFKWIIHYFGWFLNQLRSQLSPDLPRIKQLLQQSGTHQLPQ